RLVNAARGRGARVPCSRGRSCASRGRGVHDRAARVRRVALRSPRTSGHTPQRHRRATTARSRACVSAENQASRRWSSPSSAGRSAARSRRSVPLVCATAAALPAANADARASAAARSSSAETTACSRPRRSAFSGSTSSPVSIGPAARAGPPSPCATIAPAERGNGSPSATSFTPSSGGLSEPGSVRAPIRQSHARASTAPPATAWPLIAAIVGRGRQAKRRNARWNRRRNSARAARSRSSSAGSSRPALNADPSPVMTIGRAGPDDGSAAPSSAVSSATRKRSPTAFALPSRRYHQSHSAPRSTSIPGTLACSSAIAATITAPGDVGRAAIIAAPLPSSPTDPHHPPGPVRPGPTPIAPDELRPSVVVPCHNEAATIETLLRRVVEEPTRKEVIVVDDGSRDDSAAIVERLVPELGVRLIRHDRNRGKGAALKTGFAAITGNVVVIQDADLEYDPAEYASLLRPIVEGKADVVFGSRFLVREYARVHLYSHYLGNRFLTVVSNLFTGLNLTD